MAEKENLVDTVYILDPSGDGKKLTADNGSGEQHNTTRQPLILLLQFGVVVVFLVSSVAIVLRVCRSNNIDNSVKFRTSFRGLGGHVIEQETVASAKINTIEYRVEQFPEEMFTIVEDFNQRIQIVKIITNSEELCYVSELKQRSYAQPSELDFGSQVDKPYVSQMYETFEREADGTQLGERGAELCRGIPVEWIRPLSETETQISATNFTEATDISHPERRSQRGIRKCYSSCCWYMCCCNVHRFTWQRAEHFTCNHICRGCGPQYKNSYARNICTAIYRGSRKNQ